MTPEDHARIDAGFGTADDCINGPDGCAGPVEYRTTPDRDDFKSFLRCEAHHEARMATVARTLELTSPCPAPWFDEAAAGEHWDEDY